MHTEKYSVRHLYGRSPLIVFFGFLFEYGMQYAYTFVFNLMEYFVVAMEMLCDSYL